MNKILITNGTLVTLDQNNSVLEADLLIEGSFIKKISKKIIPTADMQVIDAKRQFVTPGFIQAHTHLVQTLLRGDADDMTLLDWLKTKIWPMESLHNKQSLKDSSLISLLEMQKLGTTSILDMATSHNTESVFKAVEISGMRYWGGHCLMDRKSSSGNLYQERKSALYEMERLIEKWHKKNNLIEYAICPRFAISCTEQLLKDSVKLQGKHELLIHTHASESKEEVEIIRKRTGLRNIDYLHSIGFLNEKTVIVHGIHMSTGELKKMLKTNSKLVHCPSSNLKLASGIADIEKYDQHGLVMGLGADGAPCNNSMDPFMEMRLAALLQKPKFGPKAFPAQKAFEMATIGGAKVLGIEDKVGSLEVGKLADIVTIDRSHPSVYTVENPYSAIVYSCSGRDVKNTIINGELIVKDGEHQILNEQDVLEQALISKGRLVQRIQKSIS